MIERAITKNALARMNHSDSLPRVHGRRLGETVALCGKETDQRYGTRPFKSDDPRVCPACATIMDEMPTE